MAKENIESVYLAIRTRSVKFGAVVPQVDPGTLVKSSRSRLLQMTCPELDGSLLLAGFRDHDLALEYQHYLINPHIIFYEKNISRIYFISIDFTWAVLYKQRCSRSARSHKPASHHEFIPRLPSTSLTPGNSQIYTSLSVISEFACLPI